ncbi:MAG: hypothetical protein WA760_13295, partial [Pseudolabrys sp.]
AGPGGPILVGSPQQIIDKLMYERELFAHDRFLGQVDIGGLPYTKVARSIELLATQVLPAINRPSPAGKFVDETSARSISYGAKV